MHLDSVNDPDCRRVLEIFEKAGVAVGVWDMTTEIGLPVFACLIAERERNPLRPLPGRLCSAVIQRVRSLYCAR